MTSPATGLTRLWTRRESWHSCRKGTEGSVMVGRAKHRTTSLDLGDGKVEACPYLRRPFARCYCRELSRLSSPLVRQYCLCHYTECELYGSAHLARWRSV